MPATRTKATCDKELSWAPLPKIVVLLVIFFSAKVLAQMPEQLRGQWCTQRWLRTSNVQALSKSEADAFIGLKLRFSHEIFASGKRVFATPKYSVRRLSDSDLIDAYKVDAKELGIASKSVTEINVQNQNGRLLLIPGDLVILKSNGKIIWEWKGVFFEATRCPPAKK